MNIKEWVNPGRKRRPDIRYFDPDFTIYYDLDRTDYAELVNKLKNNEELSEAENTRYGNYVLAIIECVLENSKFRNNPESEKYQLRDQMYYELLINIRSWQGKSNIFNYAYRIAYCAACHFYNNRNKEIQKSEIINDHLEDVYEEYFKDCNDHKVNNVNKEEI